MWIWGCFQVFYHSGLLWERRDSGRKAMPWPVSISAKSWWRMHVSIFFGEKAMINLSPFIECLLGARHCYPYGLETEQWAETKLPAFRGFILLGGQRDDKQINNQNVQYSQPPGSPLSDIGVRLKDCPSGNPTALRLNLGLLFAMLVMLSKSVNLAQILFACLQEEVTRQSQEGQRRSRRSTHRGTQIQAPAHSPYCPLLPKGVTIYLSLFTSLHAALSFIFSPSSYQLILPSLTRKHGGGEWCLGYVAISQSQG